MSLTLRATVPDRDLDVALEVADGETLALVGPNGAGKSSILSLIEGTLRPATGRITLDDGVLTAPGTWVPPHDRAVTTLTQDPVLFPHLTVAGNIMFALRSHGVPRREARAATSQWLTEIDLAELASRRPSQLSGGQAQRVAIARALAAGPRLLLLDEPMAALDIDVAPALREQLRRSLAERTAIIVSHDVLDTVTLADRVAVLEHGRILEQGPTQDVLARPQESFTARLAGLNLLTGIWDGRVVRLGSDRSADALAGCPVGPLESGSRVRAAVRPARVGVVEEGGAAPPGATLLRRVVTGLEPFGDLVRVRAGGIAADLTPHQLAHLPLRPGDTVALCVRAEDVSIYPAH
ncbi:sulfate/molybdate ABC transporter ATP-binding protein [Brachybacterium sp. FME24]|uniref:sulfate/molybdate ABC transporter ATP-binding protein n=1 Tax=Brachybacterium sp. FME24 TaxID=2742605 RepID=UPI001867AAB2|nr:ABC transporter ATP-binding protein [Brachybacterium sp. FME24]